MGKIVYNMGNVRVTIEDDSMSSELNMDGYGTATTVGLVAEKSARTLEINIAKTIVLELKELENRIVYRMKCGWEDQENLAYLKTLITKYQNLVDNG